MGLPEKRIQAAFVSDDFVQFSKNLEDILGFFPEVNVDWDNLIVDDSADFLAKTWNAIYFTPILEAIKKITVDDMGKEAMKALKVINIQNNNGVMSTNGYAQFTAGTLTIDHLPTTNADGFHFDERIKNLQEVIESAL